MFHDVDNGPWYQLAEKGGDVAVKNALNEDDIGSARNVFGGRGGSTNLLGYGNRFSEQGETVDKERESDRADHQELRPHGADTAPAINDDL